MSKSTTKTSQRRASAKADAATPAAGARGGAFGPTPTATWIVSGLGLAAGVAGVALSPVLSGPVLPLAIAAVAALGTRGALPLGVLALAVSPLQQAAMTSGSLGLLALVLAGLAMGILAREADAPGAWLGRGRAVGTAVWLGVIAAILTALPETRSLLYGPDGHVMQWQVLMEEASTGQRVTRMMPAWLAVEPTLGWLRQAGSWATLAALFALLASAARAADGRPARVLWWGLLAPAVALVAPALASIARGFGGTMTLPSGAELAVQLTHRAGGQLAVLDVQSPSLAFFGPGSHGAVDAVHLLVGLGLAACAFWGPDSEARPAAPPQPKPWVPIALALGAGAALFAPADALTLTGLAGLVLGAAAVVVGLVGPRGGRAAQDLLVASVLALAFGQIGPVAGWLAAL